MSQESPTLHTNLNWCEQLLTRLRPPTNFAGFNLLSSTTELNPKLSITSVVVVKAAVQMYTRLHKNRFEPQILSKRF